MGRVASRTDTASALALLGLALVYYVAARSLPTAAPDDLGPASFPTLLSAALAAAALALIWQGRVSPSRSAPRPGGSLMVAGVIAMTALYVATFTTIGFLVSTWCYTLGVTLAFRGRRPWTLVVGPTVATALIYLVLDVGLGARLPTGSMFGRP